MLFAWIEGTSITDVMIYVSCKLKIFYFEMQYIFAKAECCRSHSCTAIGPQADPLVLSFLICKWRTELDEEVPKLLDKPSLL